MSNISKKIKPCLATNIRAIRRLYFTFIELLLVLTLVTIVSGFIAIPIMRAVHDQRFQSEVSLVVDRLRLAQDLMMLFRTGAHVQFQLLEKEEGIACEIVTAVPLPTHWKNMVDKQRIILKNIRVIELEDGEKETGVKNLELAFLSQGSQMTKGILRLATTVSLFWKGSERFIPLKGYPAPILNLPTRPSKQDETAQKDFNEWLTAKTVEEIQASH